MNSKTIISNLETDIDNDHLALCYFRGQRATNSLESPHCVVEILEFSNKIENITVENYGDEDPDEHTVHAKELSDEVIMYILRTANMEDRIDVVRQNLPLFQSLPLLIRFGLQTPFL